MAPITDDAPMTENRVAVPAPDIRALLTWSSEVLGSDPEARWIVASATGMQAGDLAVRADVSVAPTVFDAVQDMVERRRSGEPLQYVLGTWAFRTLELSVDRRVLIPRPETEQVVSAALDELRMQASSLPEGSRLVAVDLGTGSGAIALSLASEWESPTPLEVWATDTSPGALELVEENLAHLARRAPEASRRVRVATGSWFEALPLDHAGQLRLVVSNPPYVSASEWEELDPVVRDYEPFAALVPGPTGLEALDGLLHRSMSWLAPGGSLVVELAPGQADHLSNRATELGYVGPEILDDLAGRPRMLVTRSPRR
jgi:release factor glutamine methyltransferase